MKKRSAFLAALAALALLIGGAILTMQDKKADTSNVERIIGYSALYGEESIGTAFDAVEQKFSEGFAGCTLLELRYDANVENKYADETMRYWQEHQQELLILESSFRTDETVAGSGFSPNHTYKDWQWHLVRAQDEPLLVATVDALAAERAVGVPLRPRTQLMTAVRAFVEQKMWNEGRESDDHADPQQHIAEEI